MTGIKRQLLIGLFFCVISYLNYAGTSGKTAPAGDVESVLEMNIVPFENLSSVLPEFRKFDTPPEGVIIASFIISNNSSDGFQISVASEQGGRLVRWVDGAFVSNIKEGDYVNYLVDLEKGLSGQLGGDMPPDSERKGIDLISSTTFFFDSQLDVSTLEAELNLMIHTKAKKDLFNGQFRDVLTFVIADL